MNSEKELLSRIPDEVVSFNPNNLKSLDSLLAKYGPEALYEIGVKLQQIALADCEEALIDN